MLFATDYSINKKIISSDEALDWMREAEDLEGWWVLWCLNCEKALGANRKGSEQPYRGGQRSELG